MVCERMLDNGVDVLYCPACGRKILIQWTPIVRQVILETGDETVVHTAYRAQRNLEAPPAAEAHAEAEHAEMDALDASPVYAASAADQLSPDDEVRLEQWEGWLLEIGFESWWTRPG